MPNEEIVNIIRDDVESGLRGMFGRRTDFSEQAVIVNPALDDEEQTLQPLAPVPWIFRCVHDGDFQGLFPTGRELEIHGVTYFDNRAGNQLLHRYIDWMGVVNQLGLEVSWRVPVDEQQYRNVRDQVEHEAEDES